MRTVTFILQGERWAQWMVMELVHRSQWFSFEPLPDGCYEITVKEEFKTQMLFMTPGKFRMKEKGAEPIEKKS